MLVIFSLKNIKRGQELELTYLYAWWIVHETPLANIKMDRQRWPEKPLILGRPGTQYVAMVTKLLSSYCGAHLVESYCKESNISELAEISFFIIFDQNLVECMTSSFS